jgi:hypothetical protein
VLDELGRTVYQSKVETLSNHITIDLETEHSGIYLLRISSAKGSVVRRLVRL